MSGVKLSSYVDALLSQERAETSENLRHVLELVRADIVEVMTDIERLRVDVVSLRDNVDELMKEAAEREGDTPE